MKEFFGNLSIFHNPKYVQINYLVFLLKGNQDFFHLRAIGSRSYHFSQTNMKRMIGQINYIANLL